MMRALSGSVKPRPKPLRTTTAPEVCCLPTSLERREIHICKSTAKSNIPDNLTTHDMHIFFCVHSTGDRRTPALHETPRPEDRRHEATQPQSYPNLRDACHNKQGDHMLVPNKHNIPEWRRECSNLSAGQGRAQAKTGF